MTGRELIKQKGGVGRQGIGHSRGGLTSKIVAVVDALGYLVRFVILPGQASHLAAVPELPEGLSFGAQIGTRRSTRTGCAAMSRSAGQRR